MDTTNTDPTAAEFAEALACAIANGDAEYLTELGNIDVRTFADAGVMSLNAGLVIRIGAREFQLTVVRSA
jgi:hypothetical protein